MDTSRQPVGQIRRRQRSNAAYRVNEERWRQLFGNSIIGITLFDRDFHLIDASPTFLKMVGYSSEELRRFTPLDISVEDEDFAPAPDRTSSAALEIKSASRSRPNHERHFFTAS